MGGVRPLRLLILSVCSCILGVALVLAQDNHPPNPHLANRYPASSRYEKVLPQLERTFRGPIRLPKVLLEVKGGNGLYPQLLSVSARAYEVIFAADSEPCQGQHVCSWGSATASDHPREFDTPSQRVQLASGLEGNFHDSTCGAYCDEAALEWHEGEFYYTIGIKAGTEKDLIRAVNSAITFGNLKRL